MARNRPEEHPRQSKLCAEHSPTRRAALGRTHLVVAQLAAELAAFAALAAAIIATSGRSMALEFGTVLAVAVCVLCVWHRRRDLLFFGVVAVAGTVGELVFVHFGIWRYAHPVFLGIPAWFPIAFGTAGVVGARIVATIDSARGSS